MKLYKARVKKLQQKMIIPADKQKQWDLMQQLASGGDPCQILPEMLETGRKMTAKKALKG